MERGRGKAQKFKHQAFSVVVRHEGRCLRAWRSITISEFELSADALQHVCRTQELDGDGLVVLSTNFGKFQTDTVIIVGTICRPPDFTTRGCIAMVPPGSQLYD